jgi:CDP-diacylglycerol---glycerol-3-phosphate 3-phosphatidyltransferase
LATSTFENGGTSGVFCLSVPFADQLTLARVLAAPVVVLLFAWDFPNHEYWATALFAVAMATDTFDGWWARRTGRPSDLGRLLDPVADKLLVMSVLVMLVGRSLPGWMVAGIIAREFLMTGLRLAALERGVVMDARDLGKLKTWVQSVAAGVGGLAAGGAFSTDIAWWTGLIAFILTWASALDYARYAPRVLRGQQPA